MKALVYEKAHALDAFAIDLVDVAEPQLREGDLLVEVRAIGINPGEAAIRQTRVPNPAAGSSSAGSSPESSSRSGPRPPGSRSGTG